MSYGEPNAVFAARPGDTAASPTRRYPYSETFFKNALRDATRESLFSSVSLSERHSVSLKPKFDTACWAYLPPHRIFIGTDLFEKDTVKKGLSQALQSKYVANHYYHELAHALYTERDMPRIKQALRVLDCPFGLFNLFEDAYIEDRYRREAKYAFEWLLMEDLSLSAQPTAMLFALIQAEGNTATVQKAYDDWTLEPQDAVNAGLQGDTDEERRAALNARLERVMNYYLRIIRVKESMHQMPLLKAWLDEFGRPPKDPGLSDLALAAHLLADKDALEAFLEDVKDVAGDSSDEESSGEGKNSAKATAKPEHEAVSRKGRLLSKLAVAVDVTRAHRLAQRFRKFFEQSTRMTSTRTPQRRMSARHYALDRAPYRAKELVGRGKRRIFLVVDCSGSMSGHHMTEGKVMLAALSQLASQGHVEGHVVLSGVTSEGPSWELFKLPMSAEAIERVRAFAGAEGLEYTMRDNLKHLQEADFCFVYTDGQICDKPINKSFFHRYGIFTWGLYAGTQSEYLESLNQYFDKALIRETVEALVDAILVQNR